MTSSWFNPSDSQYILLSRWLLLFSIAAAFFLNLGAAPLFDLDEGAFSEATREMIASGNWVSTWLNGVPRYDKPILIYWFQALSISIFGLNEWAFRLPSALAASLWIWVVFRFTSEVCDQITAQVAALLLCNALAVVVIGKAATADALLNLWLALIFCDIYRYFLRTEEKSPLPVLNKEQASGIFLKSIFRWPGTPNSLIMRIYLWMGLGFLTKGPVAVVLPILVSGLFFISLGNWRRWMQALLYWRGWLLFLAVVLPWHVLVYLDQGSAFFEGFFFKHNVGRFSSTMEGHGGHIWYYVTMLPLIMLPFTAWLLALLPLLKQARQVPLLRYLWLWFGVVFLIFSFSQTQLPHYILYGSTPLFLIMALMRERIQSSYWLWSAVLVLLLWAALPSLVTLALPAIDRDYEQALLTLGQTFLDWHYQLITLIGLVIGLLLIWHRSVPGWQRLLWLGLVHTLIINLAVLPAIGKTQQMPVKEAGLRAKSLGLPTVSFHTNMPSFSVYREAVTPARAPKAGELVFLRVDKIAELRALNPDIPIQTLYQRGGIALLHYGASQRD